MRTARIVAAAAMVFFCVLVAGAAPKPAPPKYDKTTEFKFKGVVEEVKDFECPVSGSLGGHLEVRTAEGSLLEVHLAPVAFLKDFDVVINKGDQIEVIGSKIDLNGSPAVLARQVTSVGGIYTFRNDQGRPLW